MTVPDWISAIATLGAAVTAAYAARVGLATFKQQSVTSDVQLALGIFSEINRYWDCISNSQEKYDYNMGQILAQFEIAATLFNRGILSNTATAILGDHIVEVFTAIKSSSSGKLLVERCRSSDSTFSELKTFVKSKMPKALVSLSYAESRG